jgi:PTH2 family peptidyl-tRNA hydrolase
MELKQVIVVRKDLKMGKGKLAAQVAHASVEAAERSEWRKEWLKGFQKKSVLKCNDLDELFEIHNHAREQKLPVSMIKDAGRTEIPPGTVTCVGIGPAPEREIDKVTGKLKLL